MTIEPLVADSLPPAAVAFGRLHPLLVHLPLGLVLGAFAVEGWRALRGRRGCSPFTPVALWIGAAGAVGSTMTGLAFAEEQGGGDALFWHRWLGIALTVALAALAWLGSRAARPGDAGEQVTPVLRGSLLASTLLLAWVGHLGGDMVWGKDFVIEPLLGERDGAVTGGTGRTEPGAPAARDDEPGPAAGGTDDRMAFYATKVLPLLTERCYECHGNGKRKGGLRMDVRSSIAGRNEEGQWIAQPGDPAHSLLVERCLLPADDDEAMPPEGERLKAAELEVLRTWIEDGVTMPEAPSEGAAAPAPGPPAEPGTPGSAAAPARRARGLAAQLPALTAAEVAEGASLRAKGINAVPVAQGASTFAVSMPGGRDVADADFASLFPIAGRIEELSLARSSVTDEAMLRLPPLPAVRSVRVDNTSLTDVGIAAILARAPEAETVNLVGSGATDAILPVLEQLPNLRRAFVFDTAITGAALEAFRARRPQVEVVVGQAVPGAGSTDGPPVPSP